MSANECVQAPKSDATEGGARRWLSRAAAVVYGLVMFEVVIMVSPFAFYFYAAYGPTLKWLNHSAATAWLTGFLLPHAVFTTSPFLEFLRWDLGRYFFGLGLLAFFVLAAQIYGSKLLGRKLVHSGIYRYIRHPQYLSLGLSAFGLFTMWPRMIIFAQFEREVTGERIRDKIAASKRKGMWMGGTVPLGYDLKERKLIVNPEEATLVLHLCNLYLDLGCVSRLKVRLDQEGMKSKVRISAAGNRWGGTSYSRGALYKILQNRIYLGEIHHRGQGYAGEHPAIIPRELWERVQAKLKSDHQGRRMVSRRTPRACSSACCRMPRAVDSHPPTP